MKGEKIHMNRGISRQERGVPYGRLGVYLLLSYIVTVLSLLVISFLLYKLKVSEKVVSGGIIITYIASTFLAGFLAGKKMKMKRYLWGLGMGLAYYVIFIVLSLFINRGDMELSRTILTTMVLCMGGGMLGGMLS